eukprot:gene10292-2709_t
MKKFIKRSFSTTKSLSAGQKVRLEQGISRCGNDSGPLYELPDWSFADGTPAPESKSMAKKILKKQKIFKKIKLIASQQQQAVEKKILPTTPGVKRHQRRDINFHLNKEKDENLEKLKEKRKIVL